MTIFDPKIEVILQKARDILAGLRASSSEEYHRLHKYQKARTREHPNIHWKYHAEQAFQLVKLFRESGMRVSVFQEAIDFPQITQFAKGQKGGKPWPQLQALIDKSGFGSRIQETAPDSPTPRHQEVIDLVNTLGSHSRAAEALGLSRQRISQIYGGHQWGEVDLESRNKLRALLSSLSGEERARQVSGLLPWEQQLVESYVIAGERVGGLRRAMVLRNLTLIHQKIVYRLHSPIREEEILQLVSLQFSPQDAQILRCFLQTANLGKVSEQIQCSPIRALARIQSILRVLESSVPDQAEALRDLLRHHNFLPGTVSWVETKLARVPDLERPEAQQAIQATRELMTSLRDDRGNVRWSGAPWAISKVLQNLKQSGLTPKKFSGAAGVNYGLLLKWNRNHSAARILPWKRNFRRFRTPKIRSTALEDARACLASLRGDGGRVVWKQDLAIVLRFVGLWQKSGLSPEEFADGTCVSRDTFGKLLMGRTKYGEWPELKAALPSPKFPARISRILREAKSLAGTLGHSNPVSKTRTVQRLRTLQKSSELSEWLFAKLIGLSETSLRNRMRS